MKYCQYCGAKLPDGAFSFCAVCGNPLVEENHNSEMRNKDRRKSGTHRKKKKSRKQRHKSAKHSVDSKSVDDGYDGYYDDILPADDGKVRQGVDRQAVKKIVGLVAGVLITICACVALMYLL